jgi:hypothetical protein
MSSSEHNFAEDVLEAGDAIRPYTADGSITQRRAVTINGDNQVTQVSSAGTGIRGVALFDVADGEELSVAEDGTEVDIEVGSAGATAGNAAAVDADGNFVDAGSGDQVVGSFNEGGTDGDIVTMKVQTVPGVSIA